MKVIITDGHITEIKQVALNSIRVKDTNIVLTIGTEKFNYRSTSRENALGIAYDIVKLEESKLEVLYLKVETFIDSQMIVKELKINSFDNIFKIL